MLSEGQRSLLARLLKQKTGQGLAQSSDISMRTAPASRHKPFPLTDVQQSYLAGRSGGMDLGSVSTHGYQEFDIKNLDAARYQQAWRSVIARHDMLRTVIHPDATQQALESVPPYTVSILDLRGLPAAEQQARLNSVRDEMSHQFLPLGVWPMFDIRLSLLDEDITRLHLSIDALLLDASSFPILLQELKIFYENSDARLPEFSLTFRDYVLNLESGEKSTDFAKAQAYWEERLPDFPPAPEFHREANTATATSSRFSRHTDIWDMEDWREFEQKSARLGLTGTFTLLAAFTDVLRLWNRHHDFALSISYFNRRNVHPEVAAILGDFTDILLLACQCPQNSTLLDRARLLQSQFWMDMEHTEFNGVKVVRELMRYRPNNNVLMPVVFTNILKVGDIGKSSTLGGEAMEIKYSISQTTQVLIDFSIFQFDNKVHINWDVVESAFPQGQIAAMFKAFTALLRRMLKDDSVFSHKHPVQLPEEDKKRHAAANTTEEAPADTLLHALFDEQALLRPDAKAVVTPEKWLSYAELRNRAHAVSNMLQSQDCKAGELVAVVMKKGWEQIAGVLGVLYSGAAYLPIDPGLPPERLQMLMEDAGVRIALTQSSQLQSLTWPPGVKPVAVDSLSADETAAPARTPAWKQTSRDLAYVIYTSGSTGKPKGVMIEHAAAVNTILDINSRFQIGPQDRMLSLSDLNFDLSVYDIFGLLAAGGTIVLPAPDKTRDPSHWLELAKKENVSLWNTVPTLMQMFTTYIIDSQCSHKADIPGGLSLVLLSGDWIPLSLPGEIRSLWPDVRVVALGGATEASIWSNCYIVGDVPQSWKSVPYGRPLKNQRFHILNEALQECPDNVPGQLFIAGKGLAKGYWNDPEKTAFSFFPHPETGEILYRTGDIGRWLPDGNMEFLGRKDFQVKIGGHRVELGEIESALTQYPGVTFAVVSCIEKGRNTKQLICHYLTEKNRDLDDKALRAFLRKKLPHYMVPGIYVRLDSIPLLPNGKINRRSLPMPEQQADRQNNAPPQTDLERAIAEIWMEVMGKTGIGRDDNFFEIGGNSLIAIQILTLLRRRCNTELQLRSFFDAPTIAELAAMVDAANHHEDMEEGVI